MGIRSQRRWTPQQKLAIVEEGRKEGATVSEVCRKHSLAPGLFYEWEKFMKEGALDGLSGEPGKRKKPRPQRMTPEEAEKEISRLKGIIAEIAEENLKLKKGLWP